MADGDSLPPTDTVVRACKKSTFDKGIVTSAAFALRSNIDEKALSVNWVECPSVPKERQTILEAVKDFPEGLSKLPAATLNAGDIQNIKIEDEKLDVKEDSHNGRRPRHSLIVGHYKSLRAFSFETKLAQLANEGEFIFL
ncbi:hypothetical protein [Sneathiella litorea]|uniref:Uncharacterized protein n=1 Tax=Sneathiella litorea TaxID=2606216 RepID=A0A6L8W4G5_9PROT|nr:hypothetical protein [Sneathiella litorea]MZR29619.1 hypothetical protein [Sneathiella litorea]